MKLTYIMVYTSIELKWLEILDLLPNKIYTNTELFDTFVKKMLILENEEYQFCQDISPDGTLQQINSEDFDKVFRVFQEQKIHLKWAYQGLSNDDEMDEIIY